MATAHPPHVVRQLDALHAALASAGHGAKGAIVARTAAELGCSVPTLHRWLAAHAPCRIVAAQQRRATRARRVDAGQRAISDEELQSISDALMASYRKTGRRILPFDQAVDMLRANGRVASDLSAGRIAAVLAERGLHPAQLTRPDAAVEQRSLHPNHVWQVDASVCVAYYLSNATGLQVMDQAVFYKNKPANLSRIQQERLIRYAVADHYSHELLVRYYLGSECAAHLADFLIWCFAPKQGHPMHGVPLILQMDMGSANTSAPVMNMLDRLAVQAIVHERHNSRANGSVEQAHNIIETRFESALAFSHVDDLADLNAKAVLWANEFAATHVHSRYGATRHAMWLRITAQQLRLAPPLAVLRTLPTSHPEQRRVDNNLTITYVVRGMGPRDYDLRYVPGIMAGAKVDVVVNGLAAPAIEVQYTDAATGLAKWMTVHPVQRDEAGFRLDAPIIGEQLRQAPRTQLDENRDAALVRTYGHAVPAKADGTAPTADEAALAKEKGALAFGGKVDAFKAAREAQLPAFLPKRGTPLAAPLRDVQAPRISTVAATKRVREALQRLGQADRFGPHVYAWLNERYGAEGVPDDALDALVAQFAAPAVDSAATAQPGGLRAVGGGQ
jgi:hypothetical protein